MTDTGFGTEPMPVTEIWVHNKPHFDEIVAIIILMMSGERMFPGISKATVHFTGDGWPNGRDWRFNLKEGRLGVGFGGGPLDEHAEDGKQGKKDESTTSLVVKCLMIQHPVHRWLSEEVTRLDQNAVADEWNLSSILKSEYRTPGNDPVATFNQVSSMIRHKFEQRLEGYELQGMIDNAVKSGQSRTIEVVGGKLIKILWIYNCDSYKLSAMARNKGFGVLIQRRSTGHVMVSTNNKLHHLMNPRKLAWAIREAEFNAQLAEAKKTADKDDSIHQASARDIPVSKRWASGTIGEVGNWHFQDPGFNMLNGSESHPDKEPTMIDFDHLVSIVCQNIGKTA